MSRAKNLFHDEIVANSPDALYEIEQAETLNALYGPANKPSPRKFTVTEFAGRWQKFYDRKLRPKPTMQEETRI